MTEEEKVKYTADVAGIRAVMPDLDTVVPELVVAAGGVAGILPANILEKKGCEKCSNTGYKGRLVIVEMIAIDADMQELILAKASAPKLFEAARKKGMITMQEDGILKVLQGLTTMEEVFDATNVMV